MAVKRAAAPPVRPRGGFVIRCALPDEHDDIAHVWHESWHSTGLTHLVNPGWDVLRRRIPREIDDGWSLFVADDWGEIIAFLAFRRRDDYLDQVMVAPERQGSGIGRALLAFTRTQLPDEMWLRCLDANQRAWQWYEHEGFVLEKQEPHEASGVALRCYRWRSAC